MNSIKQHNNNIKSFSVCPSVIPVLVFDNADLDSACESIIATLSNSSNSVSRSGLQIQWNCIYYFIKHFVNCSDCQSRLKVLKNVNFINIYSFHGNRINFFPLKQYVVKMKTFLLHILIYIWLRIHIAVYIINMLCK